MRLYILIGLVIILGACSGSRLDPQHANDICAVMRTKHTWYKHAKKSRSRWNVSIAVMMAIMYQESGFRPDARPPRTRCLYIFPGPRPSSAFGYSQALDGTWENYMRITNNHNARRDKFKDAIDFIGWYCNLSYKQCGISKNDPYNQYLAYHEGQGGFNRHTFRNKAWLMQTATRVKQRTGKYKKQLQVCERELNRKKSCFLWPF